MATMPSRWRSTSHPPRSKLFKRRPRSSPTPLELDVKVSKVDWVMPPFIDMQLIDGVTLLDNQGDDNTSCPDIPLE